MDCLCAIGENFRKCSKVHQDCWSTFFSLKTFLTQVMIMKQVLSALIERNNKLTPRAYARVFWGLTPPLELDILQNIYYLRKGN